ncbi:putative ATPase [Ancylobacter sp. 3268]|nr:putative ATPase [Ancylobacter sp. 3268]
MLLIEQAGEVVSQREIVDRVWSGLVVEEANLRVHVANLRKALGDGRADALYIQTIPRRGYSFVAAVSKQTSTEDRPIFSPVDPPLPGNIPPPLARMVGREGVVLELTERLVAKRFITLIGTGGIGKTTVALAVAHALKDRFDGAVAFVDFSTLTKGELVEQAAATAVGLISQSESVLPGLLAFLRDKKILLVLDNCEHVVNSVSSLTEDLFQAAPDLHILVTSREALRAEGEWIHPLAPLDLPPAEANLTAEVAMSSPAVRLFMERAAAGGYWDALSDEEVPIVTSICRRMDGIALAIEIAAGRVATHGIAGTADLLDHRFKLLWQGRRNALPRHRTMLAMVDWSNNLLSDDDRRVLARLSIFVGAFSLAAAQGVLADAGLSAMQISGSISSLTDKSLVSTVSGHPGGHYRLLDITRSYAAVKLEESGEHALIARRHAVFCRDTICQPQGESAFSDVSSVIANLRAALDWSFSDSAHHSLAISLATRAAITFRRHARLTECLQWSERALAELDDTVLGSPTEVALLEGFIVGAMFTRGNQADVARSLQRAIELAQELGNMHDELRLLSWQHIFLTRGGEFRAAMRIAEKVESIATASGHEAQRVVADWTMGTSFHALGEQFAAQTRCEAALHRSSAPAVVSYLAPYGIGQRVRNLCFYARTLWIRGFPDNAESIAAQAFAEAEARRHPLALCLALIYSTTIDIWRGNYPAAAARMEGLISCATTHSLAPFNAVGVGLRGEISVHAGELESGIADLRASLMMLHDERYLILASSFRRALAEALAANGLIDEALATLEKAFSQVDASGELYILPDLYRARAAIRLNADPRNIDSIEQDLLTSLDLAARQCAPGWILRSTIPLARLWTEIGRSKEATQRLRQALSAFPAELPDRDIRLAYDILGSLDPAAGRPFSTFDSRRI